MIEPLVQALRLIFSGDREVYAIAFTSLRFSAASVVIGALLSLPLGFGLAFRRFRGRGFVLAVLHTLLAIPTVVVGLFVYSLISRAGPLGGLGLLFTPAAVVIGQTLLCLPLITSFTHGALARVDPRLGETLTTLGASRWDVFRMTLRECRVGILAAVLAGFGRVIGEVGVAMMLGGNIRWYTRTLTTAIALETSKGEFELGLALGLVLLVIAFAVNLALHGMVPHER